MTRIILLTFCFVSSIWGLSAQSNAQVVPVPDQNHLDTLWLSLEKMKEEKAIASYNSYMEEAYFNFDTLMMEEVLHKTKEKKSDLPIWEIIYHYWYGWYFMRIVNYKEAAIAFEKAVALSEKYAIDRYLFTSGLNQGLCLEKTNQVEKAKVLYSKLEQLLQNKEKLTRKDTTYLFQIQYKLAYQHYIEDNYVDALIGYLNTLQLARTAKDTSNMLRVLYNLVHMQEYMGEQEASKAQLGTLLNILDAQGTDYSKAEALSLRLKEASTEEEAEMYFRELEAMNKQGKIDDFLYYLYIYATWLEEHISYAAAYPINKQIIQAYDSDCNLNVNYYYSKKSIIQYYLEEEQYSRVIQEANQLLECVRPLKDQEFRVGIYNQLSEAHAKLRQMDSAYKYLKLARTLNDSIEETKSTELVIKTYLRKQFEQEKSILKLQKEKEAAAVRAKLKQQRFFLLIATIIVVFSLVLIFLLYRNYSLQITTTQQLSEKNQQLTLSNNKLDRFADGVAHDILANLDLILSTGNIIVGQTLGTDALKQFYKETMVTVKRTKEYCLRLLSSAKNPEKENLTDANAVLKSVILQNEGLIKENGIYIEHSNLPKIPIEEGDLAQIFQNLLSNAIVFAGRQKGGKIEIQSVTNHSQVKIGVMDNGPGIPEGQFETIFRAGHSTRGKDHGKGLHIVKQIVEENNGQVWAEKSELGGAAIWITFKTPFTS